MANMNGDFETGWNDEVWEPLGWEDDNCDGFEDDDGWTEEDEVISELQEAEDDLYVQEYLSRRHDRGL